jgi:hypothetical protein
MVGTAVIVIGSFALAAVCVVVWFSTRKTRKTIHWCLTNAVRECGILKIPVPDEHSSQLEVPVELYILPEWTVAYERIQGGIRDGHMRRVVVHGTPGIGMSAFRTYWMSRYLQENRNSSVLLQIRSEQALLISPKGVKSYRIAHQIGEMPDDLPLIVDLAELCEPDVWAAQCSSYTILFTSLNVRKYKHFRNKGQCVEYLLQPWTLAHLLEAKRSLTRFTHLTEDSVRDMYGIYGGVPYFVLEKNADGDSHMLSALQRFGAAVADDLHCHRVLTIAYDDAQYSLVHVYRTEEDALQAQLYRYQPASAFVADRLEKLRSKKKRTQQYLS